MGTKGPLPGGGGGGGAEHKASPVQEWVELYFRPSIHHRGEVP
jgi:hypothetical protein